MRTRCIAGVEVEDALDCVHERVRMAGGASAGKLDCVAEEEVDELRVRRCREIVCDGWLITGEGALLVTSRKVGNKIC